MIPPLVPVEGSSNVAATGHDGHSLYMRFHRKSGTALYRYEGVPAQDHADLRAAESIGEHFHRHIRPFYKGVKIEEKNA